MDYQHTRKWSIIGLCTGAVAGLATITPGSGFVSQSSSLAFGALGSIISNVIIRFKHRLGFDDALDVFAVHYIGGLVGLVLTGVFAQQWVIALGYPENTPLDQIPRGGWLDGNWMQVPIQLAAIGSVSAWSFVVTYIILVVLNKIPSLTLRLADEDEIIGTDWAEMGERAYGYLPMDEEQARIHQLEEEAMERLEEAEEIAAACGRETQLDEHANGTIKAHRSNSGVDLHLNTVPAGTTTAHQKKKGFQKSLRHLMMSKPGGNKKKNKAVIGGSDMIEEPVILNYGQSKDFGGISKELDNINGNYEQKKPAEHYTQHKQQEPIDFEMDDLTDQRFYYSSTDEAGPSTTVSSGQNTPVNEIEDADTIIHLENNKNNNNK
jgi:Amt family ammonium transporter